MGKTKTINYMGKAIFVMDFSNTKTLQEINIIIEESKKHIHSKPKGSLLAITNMTNMHFSKEIADVFTSFVKSNKPYINKSSVYGMSSLARVVFNGIMKITGRDIRSFDSELNAKNFLVQN
ncbi:MAG: hypothetical protein B6I20_07345 [Bacteroidetes bacterium 4572_117]|nr:MAG: hypothetical protein B6I20_07345 [Bacteroidetes bacterium 4572_117]